MMLCLLIKFVLENYLIQANSFHVGYLHGSYVTIFVQLWLKNPYRWTYLDIMETVKRPYWHMIYSGRMICKIYMSILIFSCSD